jgi:hypothetical protein
MARTRSFDGTFEDLPLSMQRAARANRDYYTDAACRKDTRPTRTIAWVAVPGKKYQIGANVYDGEKLVELALLTCASCPVQWRCAAVAIEADEAAGVWGDTLENIRWLAKHTNHTHVLEMAESTGVSVQRTIAMVRRDEWRSPRA